MFFFIYILGWILIDRCGVWFGTILNFLRDGSIPIPETTKAISELLAEARFYCISELIDSCEIALKMKKEREVEPICRVPLITSQREEQLLISTCTKVFIILLFFKLNSEIILKIKSAFGLNFFASVV